MINLKLKTFKKREVQRRRHVRADCALEAATFGAVLPAEEVRPDLATHVAEEQVAEMHRRRALTTKRSRSTGIRARPQRPPLHGRTVWVDPAVKYVMCNSDSTW